MRKLSKHSAATICTGTPSAAGVCMAMPLRPDGAAASSLLASGFRCRRPFSSSCWRRFVMVSFAVSSCCWSVSLAAAAAPDAEADALSIMDGFSSASSLLAWTGVFLWLVGDP